MSARPRVVVRPRAGTTSEEAQAVRKRALTYLFAQRIERDKQTARSSGSENEPDAQVRPNARVLAASGIRVKIST